MEKIIACIQEKLQNTSAEGTAAEEKVATAQDHELEELMVLTTEAKARRNKEWQEKFFR